MTEAGQGQRTGRREDDACPGALRPHHAADGELLRIRVPGGAVGTAALRAVALASEHLGDGRVGLTSRGNMQVRGVDANSVPELTERLRQAGLLPAAAHERVRNIIATPLSGRRSGSRDDADPLVHDLDAALCARPGLAHLPGRFLFAVDDGSGDVRGEGADVLALALGDGWYAVRPAGVELGLRVRVENVVAAMLAVAEEFLAARAEQGQQGQQAEQGQQADRGSRAWRIAELDGGGARLTAALVAAGWPMETRLLPRALAEGDGRPGHDHGRPSSAEPGLIEQSDGRFAVCALAPLGLLTGEQVTALIAAAELSSAPAEGPRAALRITPWRRVLVRDLELPAALAARELLSAVGLVVDPGSAWSRVSACAGRPGCAKSLTDVHSDARAFAAVADPAGPAVHWAGCERGCGTPSGPEVVRLLATGKGYQLNGGELGAGDRAAAGIEVPA